MSRSPTLPSSGSGDGRPLASAPDGHNGVPIESARAASKPHLSRHCMVVSGSTSTVSATSQRHVRSCRRAASRRALAAACRPIAPVGEAVGVEAPVEAELELDRPDETSRASHHWLVVPYRRASRARRVTEPLHTLATKDSALLVARRVDPMDCFYRMLKRSRSNTAGGRVLRRLPMYREHRRTDDADR